MSIAETDLAPIRHKHEFDLDIPSDAMWHALYDRYQKYLPRAAAAREIFYPDRKTAEPKFYDFLLKHEDKLLAEFPGFKITRVPFPLFGISEITRCLAAGYRCFSLQTKDGWESYARLRDHEQAYISQTKALVAKQGVALVAQSLRRPVSEIEAITKLVLNDKTVRDRILTSQVFTYKPKPGAGRYARFDGVPPLFAHRFQAADQTQYFRIVSDEIIAHQAKRADWQRRVIEKGPQPI